MQRILGQNGVDERNGDVTPITGSSGWDSRSVSPWRSVINYKRRRNLLQNPVGTLVGTAPITAKCEDISFVDNFGVVTRRVLISSSIRCGTSDCTMDPYVRHEGLLIIGLREERRLIGNSNLDPWRQEELFNNAHSTNSGQNSIQTCCARRLPSRARVNE